MDIPFGNFTVHLLPQDDRVVWHERNGGFEPETRKAFIQYVRPGSTVLDIGAYTGLYTIAAEKLGAKTWAVEPVPVNIMRLRINCAKNAATAVVIVEAAASNRNGTVTVARPPRGVSPLPSAARIAIQPGDHPLGFVPTVRLDDFKLLDVSLIKIDVERHEVQVLEGLRETIALCHPVLIVEALDGPDAILSAVPGYGLVSVLDRVNLLLRPL